MTPVWQATHVEQLFYAGAVPQLSLFSAEAREPTVHDLAGLLCGPGQIARFGQSAARLSTVVDQPWRARLLAEECQRRGLEAEVTSSNGGYPLVRTAFHADLTSLARAWHRGAVKAVPHGFELAGPLMRTWVLASGWCASSGYLLGLDPRARQTHAPLVGALVRLGLAGAVVGARTTTPAVRVSGRRRLARLAELIGHPPTAAERAWPAGTLARRRR